MDGTLTLPFLLNLKSICERFAVPAGADLVPWLRENAKDGLAEAIELIEKEEVKVFETGPQECLQPGLKDTIVYLQGRGVKLGIFTRSCQKGVDMFLQRADLPADTFDPVVTRDTPGLASKPSADPILHCCKMWDMKPEALLVVGDGIDDMRSGRAAGSKTVAMLRPSTNDLEEAAKVALKEVEMVRASDFNISSIGSLRRFFP